MYAIIRSGDKQYKVEEGAEIKVPLMDQEIGTVINFKDVLLINDGKKTKVGSPVVKTASVKATLLKNDKDKKVIVLKYKKRKRYRSRTGHRQQYSLVRIDAIKA